MKKTDHKRKKSISPFRRKHIWNRAQYMCLFLLTVAAYLFYYSYYLLICLVFMMVLPFFSYWFGKKVFRSIRVSLDTKTKQVGIGNTIPIRIHATNSSVFANGNLVVRMSVFNRFYPNQEEYDVNLPIYANNSTQAEWDIASGYLGMVQVEITNIYVCDMLGLFSWKNSCQEKAEVIVIPNRNILDFEYEPRGGTNGESEEMILQKGDDPSEIFEIRSYIPGDKMQRVHWKLSAKQDEWMVKEYGSVVGKEVTFLVDMGIYLEKDELNDILSSFFDICYCLLEKEEAFYVCWENRETGAFCKEKVQTENDIFILLGKLYLTKRTAESGESLEKYRRAGMGQNGITYYLSCAVSIKETDGEEIGRFGDKAVLVCF